MIERIQELSTDEIHRLKKLGKDTLTAVAPTIASMIYSNAPDQLQALSDIGPDVLGSMSPQLADYLYGPDLTDGDQGIARDDVLNPDNAKKGLGQFPNQIMPPPFAPDPGEIVMWWSFADACEVCLDNAADPPRPYGTAFSSGSTEPPEHDHCRCELVSTMRSACPIHGYSRYDNRIFELSSRY
jgi:hypothetical protein